MSQEPGAPAGPAEEEGLETMTFPPVRSSVSRRAVSAVAIGALVISLGACSSSSKLTAKESAALLNKGLQAQVAGNIAEAEKDFKNVIKSDASNKFAHYNLGLIYQNQNKSSDAETQYRAALAIDSKFGPALYNLGILRANANDTAGAISLYNRAIAADPKDANAHFNLGLLLRGQGKTAEGNREVQTAVNLDSSLRSKAIAEGVPLTGS